jgi:hypothetical protein
MAKKSKKRRAWTATEVGGLKAMAKKKTPVDLPLSFSSTED